MFAPRRHLLAAIVIVGLTAVAYSGSLDNGFVWDDNSQLVGNPYLRSSQPFLRLFASDVWGYIGNGSGGGVSNYYRPLQMITYRLTSDVAGLRPSAFHAVNLLFQILAAFVAYLVMWQLSAHMATSPPAEQGRSEIDKRYLIVLMAAAFFTVHPVHSEAVIWIAALTELGCALFYLLAFWLFLLSRNDAAVFFDAVDEPAKRKKGSEPRIQEKSNPARARWLLAGSCLSFFLALLWKEMALTFPILVIAYVFFFPSRRPTPARVEGDGAGSSLVDNSWFARTRAAALASVPFWCVTAVYVVIRVAVLGYFSKVQHSWPMSKLQFAASVVRLAAQYLWHLVWPFPLKSWYVFHPASGFLDWRVLAALALLLAIGLSVILLTKRAPLVALAAIWAPLTLIPVFNITGVGDNVFCERYLYVPSLGFCLLLAWGCYLAGSFVNRRWAPNPPPAADARKPRGGPEAGLFAGSGAAVVIAAVLVVLAILPLRARVTEWSNNKLLYESALRHEPGVVFMHNDLGNELRSEGNLEGANREFETALALANENHSAKQAAVAYVGLAGIAWRRGQSQLSLDLARRGLELNPDLEPLKIAEGTALLQMGRTAEAEAVFKRALTSYQYDETALNSLGVIASGRGDYAAAIDYFQRALVTQPEFAEGHYNLAMAYAHSNAIPQSLPEFQRAVELRPGDAEFRTNLGVALVSLGRLQEARSQFQAALQISPGYPPAANNLALLNQRLGLAQ